ncbi:MAG: hypothetical protein PWR21_973 [Methanoculleus sp.]|nr:hypothetical protein [Methanoculleus sp.]MDK2989664.1 hypothetical protein [Methanoculleus sp.]
MRNISIGRSGIPEGCGAGMSVTFKYVCMMDGIRTASHMPLHPGRLTETYNHEASLHDPIKTAVAPP